MKSILNIKRNKKGQTLFLSILVGAMLFIFGMLIVNFIKPEVTTARSADWLNCTAPATDGDKVACLMVDMAVPYFFVLVFSTAGGYIVSRLMT